MCSSKDSFFKVITVFQSVLLKAEITESLGKLLLIPFWVPGSYNTIKTDFKYHVDVYFFSLLIFFKKRSLPTKRCFILTKDTLQLCYNIVLNVALHEKNGRDSFKFHFPRPKQDINTIIFPFQVT